MLINRVIKSGQVAVHSFFDRRVAFWPSRKIQELQSRRVRHMVRHAYDSVPFYREIMDAGHIRPEDIQSADDLDCLPVINDREVFKNPSRFTSSSFKESGSLTMFTSGSSGVPKPLICDRDAGFSRLIITARDRAVLSRLAGKTLGQTQLFILPEVSNSFRAQAHWDRNLIRHRTLARVAHFPVEAPFQEAVSKINEVQPDVVFSYGSYADEFFRTLADCRWKVELPRVWMYGGDAMTPRARSIAEKEFGCMIYSTYNSVETGKLGFECEQRNGFHLNIDYCAVRIVDDSGKNVPRGTAGEIVISNLYNKSMVLLNYAMGDVGRMAAGPCQCGRNLPVLSELKGRKFEIIRFADGSRHIAEVLELEFEEELSCVLQCQLRQTGSAGVLWQLVPNASVDRIALRSRILEKWRKNYGESIALSVEMVDRIDRSPGGKLIRVVRD